MESCKTYRILGIDPGTNYMGYGILEVMGRQLVPIALGDIDLHKIADPYDKLRYIFERVRELIDNYSPREVALESPFFGQNVQSMLKLGRAQGVAMAAALSCNKPVAEYAPSRIKQAIAGSGAASKEQVAGVVMRTLKVEDRPSRLDVTDGMAVALCHYYTTSSPIHQALGSSRVKGLGGEKTARKRGTKSWEQFVAQNPDKIIK